MAPLLIALAVAFVAASPAESVDEGPREDDTADLVEEAPLEDVSASDDSDDDDDVRVVKVRADPLGEANERDVFRHAGARTVVSRDDIEKSGASSVGEALDRTPGVRAVEGVAGIGSTSTKLNVGVRGVNPRLSGRATVLLDEVPIAMAPYGQPELSLFPVSLFSIEGIDTVRGGSSVRFGPQTAGGVFNLRTKAIPLSPEANVSTRIDQFGQGSTAVGFGTTVNKWGVYAEYAPQYGRSYRENSDIQVHAGLLKLGWALHPKLDIASTSHAYWENSGIPGGLSRADYDQDPFQSSRPNDRFFGYRVGEALTLTARPTPGHQTQVLAYFNHSHRRSELTHFDARRVTELPRTYNSLGVEPRHALRLGEGAGSFVDLSVGLRGAYEWASLRRINRPFADGFVEPATDDDARLMAFATYIEQAHHLLDDRVVIKAGLRGELIRASRRNNIAPETSADAERLIISRTFGQLLPAASIWVAPAERVSLFLGYGRSFGPPTFVQLAAALNDQGDLSTEITDTVELGAKASDLGGVWAEATGWFRSFESVRDVGVATVDIIGDAYGAGSEVEVGWEPGELWDGLVGSEISVGHAYTRSRIHQSALYQDKELAWYPRHEVWGSVGYAFPWPCSFLRGVEGSGDCRAFQIGGDVEWSDTQFADYGNTVVESPDGAIGQIPAYTLVDAYMRFEMLLPRYWAVNLTVGMKNVLDEEWIYRTDDINEGILRQRPRTFYLTLDVKHWFFDAQERAQERREKRRTARQRRTRAVVVR